MGGTACLTIKKLRGGRMEKQFFSTMCPFCEAFLFVLGKVSVKRNKGLRRKCLLMDLNETALYHNLMFVNIHFFVVCIIRLKTLQHLVKNSRTRLVKPCRHVTGCCHFCTRCFMRHKWMAPQWYDL